MLKAEGLPAAVALERQEVQLVTFRVSTILTKSQQLRRGRVRHVALRALLACLETIQYLTCFPQL